MNKIFKTLALAAIAVLGFTSCDDDDVVVAKAVLASTSNVTFEGVGNDPVEFLVVSDAPWTVEHPDWMTVSPTTGTGTTLVSVSVPDNLAEDGELDIPRKYTLLFKGNTKASEAPVLVYQKGDKYKRTVPESVTTAIAKEDETAVHMLNVTVVKHTGEGFIATDGTEILRVKSAEKPAEGTVHEIRGEIASEFGGFKHLAAEFFFDSNAAATTLGEATDITANFEKYTAPKHALVTVTGIFNGTQLKVADTEFVGTLDDCAASINKSALSGHMVKVTAVYCGTAAPAVKLIPVEMEDLGIFEIVYFKDDFEWMEPMSAVKPAGRTVETDDPDATAQQLTTEQAGLVPLTELKKRGYTFVTAFSTAGGTNRPEGKQMYLQRNYLKFGLTSFFAGITLPPLEDLPDNAKPVLTFDWCPMTSKNHNMDATKLVVIVQNGTESVQFDVPEHGLANGEPLKWIPVTIDLTTVTVDEDTQITIRNCDAQWIGVTASVAYRYFIDNIKIKEKD